MEENIKMEFEPVFAEKRKISVENKEWNLYLKVDPAKEESCCNCEFWLEELGEDLQICIKKIKIKTEEKDPQKMLKTLERVDFKEFLQEGMNTYQLYLDTLEG